ncbi:MAG: hypothetical protein BWY69_00301 [Planctomycetes bacterium ADurb.Bin401]|nr:MAG: hypothetical protein BWY69_00301 [Planctomycetes bacterium ADurb.Bin401]
MLNEDYKDILQHFIENEVKFLVVGAYALGAYGFPRATGDIDLWVLADKENSKKIYRCLANFGAPMENINEQTFNDKDVIFQIGIAPRRIDIITKISGVDFESAYTRKKEIELDNLKIPFISKQDLIANKTATGRAKDSIDIKNLLSAKKKK